MDFDLGDKATALRGELRELVKSHVPADFLGAFTNDPADLEVTQQFCRTLAEQGLLCMAWPEEYGGCGASVWEQTVVREEMWAHHEPRGAQYMGVNWVGPILMRHGTAEQQQKHLPPISRGEVIWCQGFSEPEAGSDLASLRTTARRDGDSWLVNGQKIWTSYATMADWIFLLARTTKVGEGAVQKKQQGLTIFLVPMNDPAIQVRPIRAMMGPHHLNEVFFDDLRVTEADVLGTVDDGWSIVGDVLSFERVGIARYARCEKLLHGAPAALGARWDDLPAELRGRWVRALTLCRRAQLMAYRVIALQQTGKVAPADAAAYRIAVTQLDQISAEVLMEIMAEVPRNSGEADYFRAEVEDHWRYAQASTVASGSVEVQRILLSRTMLGEGVVNLDLGEEAAEYGREALKAFGSAGGDELLMQAEAKPETRESLVGPVLANLGAWDLEVRSDGDSLEAAAALCRSAGYWALPYPVAERLARPLDADADGLIVISDKVPEGAISGLENRWATVTLDGRRGTVSGHEATGPAFIASLDVTAEQGDGTADVALALVLPCWTLLGMLDRAIELTVGHISARKQFGQALSQFQGVQFQLTDAELERSGLEMLARHALCQAATGSQDALADALALRMAAIEAAEVVFRVSHQLHGAVGYCDETTISWLSRYSQPLRRLPLGLSATRDELTRRVGRRGIQGLFSDL